MLKKVNRKHHKLNAHFAIGFNETKKIINQFLHKIFYPFSQLICIFNFYHRIFKLATSFSLLCSQHHEFFLQPIVESFLFMFFFRKECKNFVQILISKKKTHMEKYFRPVFIIISFHIHRLLTTLTDMT